MNRMQEQVQDFHWACNIVAPEEVTAPDAVRLTLIQEEAEEFEVAFNKKDMVGMVDALCDLLYVTFGCAVAMGIDIEAYFDEVHRANMTKVSGPKREDGKQLKPNGWKPPRIKDMLQEDMRYGAIRAR